MSGLSLSILFSTSAQTAACQSNPSHPPTPSADILSASLHAADILRPSLHAAKVAAEKKATQG